LRYVSESPTARRDWLRCAVGTMTTSDVASSGYRDRGSAKGFDLCAALQTGGGIGRGAGKLQQESNSNFRSFVCEDERRKTRTRLDTRGERLCG
jgi:hypothetical protein